MVVVVVGGDDREIPWIRPHEKENAVADGGSRGEDRWRKEEREGRDSKGG